MSFLGGALMMLHGACAGQALLTVEGVTLGQSREEALADGFLVERFEGVEFLVNPPSPTGRRQAKSVVLRTAEIGGPKRSERVISIGVSEPFPFTEQGLSACKSAASRLETLARDAMGPAAKELRPRILGSGLPRHNATVQAAELEIGKLHVHSSCIAQRLEGIPGYTQQFNAAIY